MPFRSLTDPVDVARAIAVVDDVWAQIRSSSFELLGTEEQERERLKFIVASLVPMALDEHDLKGRAFARFTQKPGAGTLMAQQNNGDLITPGWE